jgi:hypothetical protein
MRHGLLMLAKAQIVACVMFYETGLEKFFCQYRSKNRISGGITHNAGKYAKSFLRKKLFCCVIYFNVEVLVL